jgi:hypothetical protein
VIRLVDCSINTMTTINDYLAIGCSDGAVRYFDSSLRLESWFEDLAAGPVMSLSFSNQKCPYPEGEGGGPGMSFWVPDFMVRTSSALSLSDCLLSGRNFRLLYCWYVSFDILSTIDIYICQVWRALVMMK